MKMSLIGYASPPYGSKERLLPSGSAPFDQVHRQHQAISHHLDGPRHVDGLCHDSAKLREILDSDRISNSIEAFSRPPQGWLRKVSLRNPTSVFIISRDRAARASTYGRGIDPLAGRSTVSPSSPPAGGLRAAGLRKRQRGPFLEALAGMR